MSNLESLSGLDTKFFELWRFSTKESASHIKFGQCLCSLIELIHEDPSLKEILPLEELVNLSIYHLRSLLFKRNKDDVDLLPAFETVYLESICHVCPPQTEEDFQRALKRQESHRKEVDDYELIDRINQNEALAKSAENFSKLCNQRRFSLLKDSHKKPFVNPIYSQIKKEIDEYTYVNERLSLFIGKFPKVNVQKDRKGQMTNKINISSSDLIKTELLKLTREINTQNIKLKFINQYKNVLNNKLLNSIDRIQKLQDELMPKVSIKAQEYLKSILNAKQPVYKDSINTLQLTNDAESICQETADLETLEIDGISVEDVEVEIINLYDETESVDTKDCYEEAREQFDVERAFACEVEAGSPYVDELNFSILEFATEKVRKSMWSYKDRSQTTEDVSDTGFTSGRSYLISKDFTGRTEHSFGYASINELFQLDYEVSAGEEPCTEAGDAVNRAAISTFRLSERTGSLIEDRSNPVELTERAASDGDYAECFVDEEASDRGFSNAGGTPATLLSELTARTLSGGDPEERTVSNPNNSPPIEEEGGNLGSHSGEQDCDCVEDDIMDSDCESDEDLGEDFVDDIYDIKSVRGCVKSRRGGCIQIESATTCSMGDFIINNEEYRLEEELYHKETCCFGLFNKLKVNKWGRRRC